MNRASSEINGRPSGGCEDGTGTVPMLTVSFVDNGGQRNVRGSAAFPGNVQNRDIMQAFLAILPLFPSDVYPVAEETMPSGFVCTCPSNSIPPGRRTWEWWYLRVTVHIPAKVHLMKELSPCSCPQVDLLQRPLFGSLLHQGSKYNGHDCISP